MSVYVSIKKIHIILLTLYYYSLLFPDLIYHAAESSTSTEASPTLPRRSFHRKRERSVGGRSAIIKEELFY